VRAEKKANRAKSDAPMVWLVHPGAGEAACAAELSTLGFRVVGGPWSSPEITRNKVQLPVAVIVDLSRSPSSGRDIAVAMRSNRELVNIPFILVGGAPDRVAMLKQLLPDAIEAIWAGIGAVISAACKNPLSGGRKLSVFAAYENKSLAEKLGIKHGTTVVTINAPAGLRAILGALPDGVKICRAADTRDLTLWFLRSAEELSDGIVKMKPHAASGRLWIIWRKGASAESPVNQISIRKEALANGLVDFRITRIDDDWAGLRFTIRKSKGRRVTARQAPSPEIASGFRRLSGISEVTRTKLNV
jgi:hypothetical protein